MGPFSAFSPIHFLIWYILARSTNMSWKLFFILSLGWEVLEWIFSLFFNSSFFVENMINRTTDIIINIAGFYLGKK
jgi:hypothetical protein